MTEGTLEKINRLEEAFSRYEITEGELARVRGLREKLEERQMTVAVIGQFKRGKSTLINAILGENIMPVGIVPVTAVVTSARYGERAAFVDFENGIRKPADFNEIDGFINEQANDENRLGVAQVEIYVPSEFLKTGITLVDTPGVGSVHRKNTDTAYAFVRESDAVIFMLSVDSPINQIEIEFLQKTKEYASKFYFAVNKADTVDDEELADYMKYCGKLICQLMDVDEAAMFAVSAKKGTGLQPLKEAVENDCRSRTDEILTASVELKLKDVIESALQQITLYRAALNLPREEFGEKLGELDNFCCKIKKEAAGFCRDFGENPLLMQGQLNRTRNLLSDKVSELFGISYHYDISQVNMDDREGEEDEARREAEAAPADEENFIAQTERICDELMETLNTVFMYQEENAYTVVRRISDLNRLVRLLVRMRAE